MINFLHVFFHRIALFINANIRFDPDCTGDEYARIIFFFGKAVYQSIREVTGCDVVNLIRLMPEILPIFLIKDAKFNPLPKVLP